MTPLDLVIAVAGGLAAGIGRLVGGSRRATWAIVVGLFAVSAITTLIIGSTQRPTDLTFDDLRLDRIPAMTSWVRLEGELSHVEGSFGGTYQLHDTADDRMYVVINTPVPLADGHTVVTGHLSVVGGGYGNVGSIDVDIPAEPRRNEPFQVILLPAVLGIVVAIGVNAGYPVVRGDGRTRAGAVPLGAGEPLPARWSGRIASEVVARSGTPGTIALNPVEDLQDLSDLAITDALGTRTVRIRRAAPARQVRVCRIGGCRPGLEVHSSIADLLLVFDDVAARDRLVATLR